jgi:hypothetical protein
MELGVLRQGVPGAHAGSPSEQVTQGMRRGSMAGQGLPVRPESRATLLGSPQRS